MKISHEEILVKKIPLKDQAYLKVGKNDVHSIKELNYGQDFKVIIVSLLFGTFEKFYQFC